MRRWALVPLTGRFSWPMALLRMPLNLYTHTSENANPIEGLLPLHLPLFFFWGGVGGLSSSWFFFSRFSTWAFDCFTMRLSSVCQRQSVGQVGSGSAQALAPAPTIAVRLLFFFCGVGYPAKRQNLAVQCAAALAFTVLGHFYFFLIFLFLLFNLKNV